MMIKTTLKTIFLPLMSLLTAAHFGFAQSKIKDNTMLGTSPFPHPGAVLEVESSSRGVLMPRISLIRTTTWGLNGTDTAGMIVYNNNPGIAGTSTAPALGGGVGFYYWDGLRWVGMSEGTGDFWRTGGNTGTTAPAVPGATAAGKQYLGTEDTQNLAVGTNSITRAVFDRQGNLYGGNNPVIRSTAQNALVWGTGHTDAAPHTLVTGYNNTLSSAAIQSTVSGFTNFLGAPNAAVFGQNNKDTASNTLVAGYNNMLPSDGNATIVTGGNNYAAGNHSAIFGQGHKDSANYSLIAGQGNIVSTGMHHALVSGSYNIPVDEALFILADGTVSARSNAFVVTKKKTSGAAINGLIILSASLPKYASAAAAVADASLPQGAFFKVNTVVHQKD